MTPKTPKLKSDPASDFLSRVRYLIDTYDQGNVSEAARRLGVSQRGLQKIYRGTVVDPRLPFIQSVIRTYRTEDPLWIVMGVEATSPAFIDAMVEARVKESLRRLAADPPRVTHGSARTRPS